MNQGNDNLRDRVNSVDQSLKSHLEHHGLVSEKGKIFPSQAEIVFDEEKSGKTSWEKGDDEQEENEKDLNENNEEYSKEYGESGNAQNGDYNQEDTENLNRGRSKTHVKRSRQSTNFKSRNENESSMRSHIWNKSNKKNQSKVCHEIYLN